MSVTTDLIYFFLALGLGLSSSVVLARQIDQIGTRFELPEPLLGILTALGADSPEISSAIVALQAGRHNIGAGIVFGSNLYNLAALLGLSAVVAGRVRIRRSGVMFNAVTALAVTVVASVLAFGLISGPVALGLVLVPVVPYTIVAAMTPRRVREVVPGRVVADYLASAVSSAEKDVRRPEQAPKARQADLLGIVPSVAGVALSSVAMVHTVTEIGDHFGLSDAIIGMLILATVTGLPNLVAAVRLARAGRGSAVVSEAFNSNTINIAVGLVVPAIAVGVSSTTTLTRIAAIWLLALTVLTAGLTSVRGGLLRWEGAAVIACYLAFVGLVIAG